MVMHVLLLINYFKVTFLGTFTIWSESVLYLSGCHCCCCCHCCRFFSVVAVVAVFSVVAVVTVTSELLEHTSTLF